MRSKVFIVIVALVLGGVAAVMAAGYLRSARTDIAAQNEPVEVLVAVQDLPRGMTTADLVDRKLIEVKRVPAQFVAADAVSSERVIADQVLAIPVSAGEQLTRSRFEYPAEAGLSYTVPEDMVAISIAVDEVTGVAGLLKAGDSVVVYQSFEPKGRETAVTKVAIAKARVLAVGDDTSAAPDDATQTQDDDGLGGGQQEEKTYQTVTLALNPRDAASTAFAQQFGTIHLGLLPENAEPPAATLSPTTFKSVGAGR